MKKRRGNPWTLGAGAPDALKGKPWNAQPLPRDSFEMVFEPEPTAKQPKQPKQAPAYGSRKRAAAAAFHSGPTDRDELLVAIAKLGGIRQADARRWFGAAGAKEVAALRVGGIRRIVAPKGKGLGEDRLGTALRELGFPVATHYGQRGEPLADVLHERLTGDRPVYVAGRALEQQVRQLADDRAELERKQAEDFAAGRTNPTKRRAGKAKKRTRRNPASLVVLHNPTEPSAAALKAFRQFHDADPQDIRPLPKGLPDLVALGTLRHVIYQPTHSARSGPAFKHKFGPGRHVLAATVDGRHLYIIPDKGRPFRVDWQRGIIG